MIGRFSETTILNVISAAGRQEFGNGRQENNTRIIYKRREQGGPSRQITATWELICWRLTMEEEETEPKSS